MGWRMGCLDGRKTQFDLLRLHFIHAIIVAESWRDLDPHYIWGRLQASCVIRSPANVDAAKRDELITGHEKPDAGGAIQCKLKVSL